jgi:hypothetical protein
VPLRKPDCCAVSLAACYTWAVPHRALALTSSPLDQIANWESLEIVRAAVVQKTKESDGMNDSIVLRGEKV